MFSCERACVWHHYEGATDCCLAGGGFAGVHVTAKCRGEGGSAHRGGLCRLGCVRETEQIRAPSQGWTVLFDSRAKTIYLECFVFPDRFTMHRDSTESFTESSRSINVILALRALNLLCAKLLCVICKKRGRWKESHEISDGQRIAEKRAVRERYHQHSPALCSHHESIFSPNINDLSRYTSSLKQNGQKALIHAFTRYLARIRSFELGL